MKKYNYISWIVITATLIIGYSDAVPLSDFISFGQGTGDKNLHHAVSSAIAIPLGFPYFNETYSSIYVSLISYIQ